MELQALLVLCGVGVVVVAVILLMGLFSNSGTSYEEAIAQQRKATTELLALAENKKPKKNAKKANKKLAKKEKNKENAVASHSSDIESEAPAESGGDEETVPSKPHVEFRPPVVVDVPKDAPLAVKIRKRGKDPKVKPILVNKEDPSCVSDTSVLPTSTAGVNHFEELHPKDEFELLHSALEKVSDKEVVEKKDIKTSKGGKGKGAKLAPQIEPAVEEAPRERLSVSEPKEQRKAKKSEKKSTSEESVELPREEVVQPLNIPQPSELTTEKLLKQALASAPTASPPGGKKKKKPEPNVLALMGVDGGGVNVSELVRVVKQAVLSRNEIQTLTETLLNKHHDPLPQHSEWTEGPNDPMQKLKKQLADKEKQLADEMEASQALHAKLKELRANLNAERSRVTATSRASEQAAAAARAELHTLQARLQRLIEDNQQLAQDKLMLQAKLGAEGEAQAQRVQMEMHIQRLSETEAGLMQQVNALQAEMNAHAVDAHAARDQLCVTQQHAAELAQQLQEANRVVSDLEQQRQFVLQGKQAAQQELRIAQERLNGLSELQNEVQRLLSRAQAAEVNADKIKEEAVKEKQQLLLELASLKEQLAARESELAEVKQMKVTPAQNGLPPANGDQHKTAELAKVESIVESLRNELSSAQRCSREQKDQLNKLNQQLTQYQDKNNELRTKNWKVMEALQSAERSLQNKAAAAMPAQDSLREAISKAQEMQYSEVVSILRDVCPSVAPTSAAGRSWLQAFAQNLKKELAKKEAPPPTEVKEDRVDLQAQNEQLQALVDKYKKIIDDTEGVLSRLQQNVTSEEQRWAAQLADKQRELEDLRQRTVQQMQSKIDDLQAELRMARSNHSNSFAVSERLTEERLMAGLSDKHNADLSNGPLQRCAMQLRCEDVK